jgi:flagella synthesis protein FlgN
VPDRAAFLAALADEHAAFAAFVELLETESACLLDGDVDALLALAQTKSERVTRLSGLAEVRRAFLRDAGFRPDRVGMSEWLLVDAGAEHAHASRLWTALLEHASRAQLLNESNGALIAARLSLNQSALAALQAAAQQATLYGPDGTSTLPATLGRNLGTA